ncbi:MAG TPA: DJ-1 family glyoxalase III [Candidatus Synoicihabitans sp.]|nr:DJ-1 family glyoxalase III [Candidatus Synoicihabitans sp.]
MPTILVILPEGFEEVEAVTPIDLWRRAGFTVKTAALGETIHVTGRNGITLHSDTTIANISMDERFDVVFLPGGPGVKHLRADPRVRKLIETQAARPAWLVAICAAPTVLHDAGLLEGRRYTAHFSVENELPHIRASERVVVDGPIITSRGAGTAVDFALEVIRQLANPAEAEKVAVSICA